MRSWLSQLSLLGLLGLNATLQAHCQREVKLENSALLASLEGIPDAQNADWSEEDVVKAASGGLLSVVRAPLRSRSVVISLPHGEELPAILSRATARVDVRNGSDEVLQSILCNRTAGGGSFPDGQEQVTDLFAFYLGHVCEVNAEGVRLRESPDSPCAFFSLDDECFGRLVRFLTDAQAAILGEEGDEPQSIISFGSSDCYGSNEAQRAVAKALSQSAIARVMEAAEESGRRIIIIEAKCQGNDDFVVAPDDAISLLEKKASAARALATTTSQSRNSLPRTPLVWLSIGMAVAVVFAVIPLIQLSSVSDPIICTKLFGAQH